LALIEATDLVRYFPVQEGWIASLFTREKRFVRAVDGINLRIPSGETFGLVGESGSGKTTTGRLLVRLEHPTSGMIRFDGKDLSTLKGQDWKEARQEMQMIFQDPFASLNPRMKIGRIIGEGLEIRGVADSKERKERVAVSMEMVGLAPPEQFADRYPHELSGGQRQRVGIARAIAVRPKFIAADEPVSSLDVSIRAQVLNLMLELKEDLGLTYMLISHDIAVVKYMSEEMAVMYLGKIVESAASDVLFKSPLHPYTRALLSAIPTTDASERQASLEGEMPSPVQPPKGCRFHTRCPDRRDKCCLDEPSLVDVGNGHMVACWNVT
jgi:oligopeptide/dipeptide ABC transporter ATP-binding protein